MKIQERVDEAARLIKELLPHLEAITHKRVSPARRQDLRSKTGKGKVFRLTQLATRLSSETANLVSKGGSVR